MITTNHASPAFLRGTTRQPDRLVGLEKLIDPLAEILAADDDPRATLDQIVAMLLTRSRSLRYEAEVCLRDIKL